MTKAKMKQTKPDRLAGKIISTPKRKGVRCGTGDQIHQLRRTR